MVTRVEDLPTWTEWLEQYRGIVHYSLRQLRRLVFDEPRQKLVKRCGWSRSDHNRAIQAVTLLREIRDANAAGRDLTAWLREADVVLRDADFDLFTQRYEPKKEYKPKRRARRVTLAD